MSFSWFKNLSSRQKTGLILIFLGTFSLFIVFSLKGYQEFQRNLLSFSQTPELTTAATEEDLPTRIIIPKAGLDLLVYPAKVVNNLWETSEEGASYLLGSGVPGKEGNVVIYGHNKNYLFGPIRWLKENEEIKVINKKGEEYRYKIVQTKTVTPEAIEVLEPTEDATLTLYTCTGFFDRERFIVVARLQTE